MASFEAAVQIDGPHQRFKGIAANVGVAHACALCGQNELFESHVGSQSVKCLALHDFGAGRCEKTLALVWKVVEENVAHDSLEHGIAQIFESFVVERFRGILAARFAVAVVGLAVLAALFAVGVTSVAERLVRESDAVYLDIVRVKAQYVV